MAARKKKTTKNKTNKQRKKPGRNLEQNPALGGWPSASTAWFEKEKTSERQNTLMIITEKRLINCSGGCHDGPQQ